MVNINVSKIPAKLCPCGRKFAVINEGQFGPFYKCPRCGETASIAESDLLKAVAPDQRTCAKCGKPMKYLRAETAAFLACSAYPECIYQLNF
jgi:hypothetical protein